MASGKRGEFLGWDKADVNCDVGLGLKMQFQQHQQQQRGLVRKFITPDEHSNTTTIGMQVQTPVTFTADQRQELERQTVIYKYMMASMPVPPQLLIPLSQHPSATASPSAISPSADVRSGGGGGGRGGGVDPEPWRCRRTDGKKWRCSRDVAPDQKYCERHSHKGRPSARSRKPVESLLSPPSHTHPHPPVGGPTAAAGKSMEFPSLVQYNLLSHSSYRYTPPDPRFMKKDALPATITLGSSQHLHEDQSSRPFIDAWSLADANPGPTTTATHCHTPGTTVSSSSPIHSILPLTLSVSSGTDIDHPDHIPDVHDHDSQGGAMRSCSLSQPLNWMTTACWSSSPPGGPLAEALCLGIPGTETGGSGMRSNLEETNEQFFRLH